MIPYPKLTSEPPTRVLTEELLRSGIEARLAEGWREPDEAKRPDPFLAALEDPKMPPNEISFISVENGRLVEKARIVNLGAPPR